MKSVFPSFSCILLAVLSLYKQNFIFPINCADILCTGISKWITFCYFSEIVSIVITKQFWVRFSHHSYCVQCTPDTLTCSIWLIFQLFDEDGLCAPDIYFCFSIGNHWLTRNIKCDLQVNLFQKHLFLHQLTHNMTKDYSLNYEFST